MTLLWTTGIFAAALVGVHLLGRWRQAVLPADDSRNVRPIVLTADA